MPVHGRNHQTDEQRVVLSDHPLCVSTGRLRIFVVSNVRLYREGVAMTLAQDETLDVVGLGDAADMLSQIAELRPNVALLDYSLIDRPGLPRRMLEVLPSLKVVAIAVSEGDRDVIACAEAGISAFVPRDGSAADLIAAVHQASRGELVCTPRIAALLFGHVAALSAKREPPVLIEVLTHREREIIPLLEQGLSNKEIARQLRVGAATVKNHIHNILEKLHVRRRGEVAARIRHDGLRAATAIRARPSGAPLTATAQAAAPSLD
jgi:DNA-binding NarL/FixJ family response regulator